MPKETFFNLEPKKREAIELAALDEFSANSYHRASVSRIVEKVGIAKGSFYQYFENKMDLYRYLVSRIGEKKMAHLSPLLLNPTELDFFSWLRALFHSGLQFACHEPKFLALGNRLLSESERTIYDELVAGSQEQALRFYEGLIEKAKSDGHLRPDLDDKLMAYMIHQMTMSIMRYHRQVLDKSFDDADLELLLDDFIRFLQIGMANDKEVSQ